MTNFASKGLAAFAAIALFAISFTAVVSVPADPAFAMLSAAPALA